MSSRSSRLASWPCLFVLALSGSTLLYAQPANALKGLSCPDSVTVIESIAPAAPWQNETAGTKTTFERISVYNGTRGDEEYDLAPDDQKQTGRLVVQTWNLKGYRTMNLFLRCRYRDTKTVLWLNVPPEIQTCTLRFQTDSRGKIVGKSGMECH